MQSTVSLYVPSVLVVSVFVSFSFLFVSTGFASVSASIPPAADRANFFASAYQPFIERGVAISAFHFETGVYC